MGKTKRDRETRLYRARDLRRAVESLHEASNHLAATGAAGDYLAQRIELAKMIDRLAAEAALIEIEETGKAVDPESDAAIFRAEAQGFLTSNGFTPIPVAGFTTWFERVVDPRAPSRRTR